MMVFVLGMLMIGILLIFIIRVQRGLLGLILGGLAAGLMIYWMREVRGVIRKELGPQQVVRREWTYDMLKDRDTVRIIADVPGPAETVRVELDDGSLKIFGGQGFRKKVSVPRGLTVAEMSYLNGILNVKLSRVEDSGGGGVRRRFTGEGGKEG